MILSCPVICWLEELAWLMEETERWARKTTSFDLMKLLLFSYAHFNTKLQIHLSKTNTHCCRAYEISLSMLLFIGFTGRKKSQQHQRSL